MNNESPNILLIIADDLSPSSLESVNTPNIDELADNGIVFENAWATPQCSPTRATIATGRYGFRTGVGNVITGNDPGLLENEVTIAEALDANPELGYSEAVIGKWHLGSDSSNANSQGYDYYAGNESGGLRDYYSWTKAIDSDLLSAPIEINVSEYVTKVNVDDATEWLNGDKRAHTPNLDDPWFLQLAVNAPHTPYHKPPEELLVDQEYIDLPNTPEDIEANPEPYYEAAIQALDTEIGRLLGDLENKGELEDTLVMFIGDNGSPTEVADDPDRAKSTLYEGGIEIPMIISGHGVIQGDGTEDSLVNTTDLFATVLELAGADYDVPSDSVSLVPYLTNQSHPNEREWAYSEFFDESNDNTFGGSRSNYGQTIRNQEYKLIRFDEDGREEFYTLDSSGERFDEQSESELLQGNVDNLTPIQRENYEFLVEQLDALNNSETADDTSTNVSSELAVGSSISATDINFDSTFNNHENEGIDFADNNQIDLRTSSDSDNANDGLLLGSDNIVEIKDTTFNNQLESGIDIIGNNSQALIENNFFSGKQFSGIDITQPEPSITSIDGNTVNARNTQIIKNVASDYKSVVGGGIFSNTDSISIVEDRRIANNIAQVNGGGIYNAGQTTVTRSSIIGNEAVIGNGGGVFNLEGSSFTNNNSSILDNTPDEIFI
ncbi:sulfatase-like hydrolase/transferase [Pleurocapsa sp. PCC 7319]|uniref:sulfatase-like hydrolase/transferase n=1 Tax=Pleurocapsa sp. PCC 7319 TaxID=118161 RepID=UPI0003449D97|nr:sulfatase-like hydrolase/transferase [Pleurocapsa sp. PCC 7319]